jgi:predicted dithiol-disulfide oxidoreductase (DUF899 family)
MDETKLLPAEEMVRRNNTRVVNESPVYRSARNKLLAAEIEARRQLERVAELRRALPPGGPIAGDYTFVGEHGPVRFADLFGDKQTLMLYSMMYGPQRTRVCPVCNSLVSAWAGTARNVGQRLSLAIIARSPIERLIALKKERGWHDLHFFSDTEGDYTRAYVSAEDGDVPGLTVFTRRDGTIRHFWSGELGPATADPGQDPRGAPDIDPLWIMLDLTPEGRGTDWYPSLPPELVRLG